MRSFINGLMFLESRCIITTITVHDTRYLRGSLDKMRSNIC